MTAKIAHPVPEYVVVKLDMQVSIASQSVLLMMQRYCRVRYSPSRWGCWDGSERCRDKGSVVAYTVM